MKVWGRFQTEVQAPSEAERFEIPATPRQPSSMMLAVKPVADSGKAELVAIRVSGDRAVEKTKFCSMPGQSRRVGQDVV